MGCSSIKPACDYNNIQNFKYIPLFTKGLKTDLSIEENLSGAVKV